MSRSDKTPAETATAPSESSQPPATGARSTGPQSTEPQSTGPAAKRPWPRRAPPRQAGRPRAILIWAVLAIVIAVPIVAAAFSPLLAWRQPVYIAAGFAGVLAMAFLLLQPLLAGGTLPGLAGERGRRLHRWIGIALVIAVAVHVGGLAITSPPDVVDVLLFRSPTPFALWGVIALWTVLLAALIAALRTSLALRPRTWRRIHTTLALITVIASVVHAVLIEGTMETVSKVLLCAAAVGATAKVIVDLKVWVGRGRPAARR
ncbi:MAG: ferric reductase-like transmembrane domain-containing protein [Pseudomonadota bacterium]